MRDTRWVCGLTLLAASRRFGVQIVVIDLGDDTGRRNDPMSFGVAANHKDGPVVLVLKDGHYQLAVLKPGCEYPEEWIQAEEAKASTRLCRGGGRRIDGWRAPATPPSPLLLPPLLRSPLAPVLRLLLLGLRWRPRLLRRLRGGFLTLLVLLVTVRALPPILLGLLVVPGVLRPRLLTVWMLLPVRCDRLSLRLIVGPRCMCLIMMMSLIRTRVRILGRKMLGIRKTNVNSLGPARCAASWCVPRLVRVLG